MTDSQPARCPFCGSPAETFAHDNHGLMYTSHGCSNKECPANKMRCQLGFWNTRGEPVGRGGVVTDEMVAAACVALHSSPLVDDSLHVPSEAVRDALVAALGVAP